MTTLPHLTALRAHSMSEWLSAPVRSASAPGVWVRYRFLCWRAAERSEKALLTSAVKRSERWKKILFEASQQSRRVKRPLLAALEKPENAFVSYFGDCRVLLSESPTARPIRHILEGQSARSAVLAVGPEGGWTESEFAAANAAKNKKTRAPGPIPSDRRLMK